MLSRKINQLVVSAKVEQTVGLIFAVLEGLDEKTKEETVKRIVEQLLSWLRERGIMYDGEWFTDDSIDASELFDVVVG